VPDIKTNLDQDERRVAAEQSAEAKALTEDSAAAELEVAKLAADLDQLRQTLLRRQADFDNYRKRIEKERSEDSKRSAARVIEALIPMIDNFEQALAAQVESQCDGFRRGSKQQDLGRLLLLNRCRHEMPAASTAATCLQIEPSTTEQISNVALVDF